MNRLKTMSKNERIKILIKALLVVINTGICSLYLNFGLDTGITGVNLLVFALAYSLPMIIIVGLYGINTGLICYTLLLVPALLDPTSNAFILTFHLLTIYAVGFVVHKRFLKTIGKTILSAVIIGLFMGAIFYVLNDLIAEKNFSDIELSSLAETMAIHAEEFIIAFLILYITYRFLPERLSRFFEPGCFRYHEKNTLLFEMDKHKTKTRLGDTMTAYFAAEALILGVFAAIVANTLIPGLQTVVGERDPLPPIHRDGIAVSGSAVSGAIIGGMEPNDNLEDVDDIPDDEIGHAPAKSASPDDDGLDDKDNSISDEIKHRRHMLADRLKNHTGFGGHENEDDTNIFILNDEGIAFDIKLILYLLNIIMPLVALINHRVQKNTVAPIVAMSGIMDEFADDSIDTREIAAGRMENLIIHSKDEIALLHESLTHTVEEVIEYIEKMRQEHQLKEDLRVAKRANEAKSNFLSNVSHEIRTPINAVLGMDEMILRQTKDTEIRKYAMDIKNSGRTLVSLVNDILDFSRIEAGKLEILPVEYEMSSTLNDLVNMISVKADEKGLRLLVEVDEHMPHLLIGDEIRIKQCIINILTNAVKYTEEGTVKMTVSYQKYNDNHIMLGVKVKDTGIGMKEEDLKKLFSPFERIEENRNRNIEGTGLGMSIVKQLLDMMGSELLVESVYGQGSEFSFNVKQEVISWEPMGDFAKMYERSVESMDEYRASFQAPDAHILIVDDTKMNLTVIEGLLEPTAVKITTAMSGKEALELVKDREFDIIFLDQRMPGMDGIQTLHAMKEDAENKSLSAPCIALTANAISGARENFIKAGFDDYLTKPIDSVKLESTIASFLPDDKVLRPGDIGYEDNLYSTSGSSNTGGETTGKSKSSNVDFDPTDPVLISFSQIDVIDYKSAMQNCMRENILLEAIKDFYTASKTAPDEIEGYLDTDDIRNYTIKVHALKSSARLIGALDISKQAAYLEKCGDENQKDEIIKKTPKLISDYKKLNVSLAKLYEGENLGDDRPYIDVSTLKEAYAGLREYADAFDFDSADSIMSMLSGYRIPDDEIERYERIRDMVTNLDHDGLMDEL